jgi:ankyrin repeat protein
MTEAELLARYAADGAHENIQALLPFVSPVAREDGAKWSALHLAAHHGRLRVLRVFLAFLSGADGVADGIDVRDHRGRTALHLASRSGRVRAARMLENAGASLDARDEAGDTPAVMAAAHGRVEVIEMLFRLKRNHSAGSAELGAAIARAQCLNTASAVLQARPEAPRDRVEMGRALLAVCSQGADLSPLGTVRLLCALDADCNVKDEHDAMTPLHFAAKHGWEDVVRFLLVERQSHGVNELSNDKRTPLVVACMHGRGHSQSRVIKLLLRRGANPSVHPRSAVESPLYRVCHLNDVSVVRALVDAGASLDSRSTRFESGVLSAGLHAAKDVLTWMAREGYDFSTSCRAQVGSPFHSASFTGNLRAMRHLVALGANPADIDSLERTPLHSYASGLDAPGRSFYVDNSSCDGIVQYLVEVCGVDPDACRKQDGCAALHIAACDGHSEAVAALLKGGAAVDAVCDDGMFAKVSSLALVTFRNAE